MWTWSRYGSGEEEGRQGGTPRGDSGSRKNVLGKEGNNDEARVDCSLIVVLQEAVKENGEEFPRAKHERPRAKSQQSQPGRDQKISNPTPHQTKPRKHRLARTYLSTTSETPNKITRMRSSLQTPPPLFYFRVRKSNKPFWKTVQFQLPLSSLPPSF